MRGAKRAGVTFLFLDFEEREIAVMQERAADAGMPLCEWLRECIIHDVRKGGDSASSEPLERRAGHGN